MNLGDAPVTALKDFELSSFCEIFIAVASVTLPYITYQLNALKVCTFFFIYLLLIFFFLWITKYFTLLLKILFSNPILNRNARLLAVLEVDIDLIH